MSTSPISGRREKHIRVAEDLAEMLGGIWFHERTNIADLVDPLLREAITKRYATLPIEIRRAFEARKSRRKARA